MLLFGLGITYNGAEGLFPVFFLSFDPRGVAQGTMCSQRLNLGFTHVKLGS